MPLPLPRRSKHDRISHEEIAISIEDDQRDYSDLELTVGSENLSNAVIFGTFINHC